MDDQAPKTNPFEGIIQGIEEIILFQVDQRLAPLAAQIAALEERIDRLEAQVGDSDESVT